MKIAYLFHLNETNEGVFRKIVSQIDAWKANGHKVIVFQLTRTAQVSKEQWHAYKYSPSAFRTRIKAWDDAIDDILAWSPDIVYYRYDMFYPALYRLLRNIPVITEVNTDDAAEYRLGSRMRGLYNYLTRNLVFGNVDGMVHVSGELALLSHFRKYRKKHIVIGNGINLAECEQLPAPLNQYPRLAFMGSPGQLWHGVDKILKIAEKLPSWSFDLIGISKEQIELSNMQNVICHGYLNKKAYENVLATADVAIGTMALHRKNMNEATPLKVREYLAYGLPIIIGYKDTDFPCGAPFLLQLPNCENVTCENIESIRAFVERWKGKRVPRTEIAHLDVQKKETERLKFMLDVIQRLR
jgi:glycosyltransferase involved in cell wall biosynthesis